MFYVITLGFDEKFALRALTRRGLKNSDEVLVIIPTPIDNRAETAYRQLSDILVRIFQYNRITRLEVNPRNFLECLIDIIKVFVTRSNEKFVLVLSGGFRALILEVLMAASMLGLDAEIELDLEDYSSTLIFPLRWFTPLKLEEEDIEILRYINNLTTLSKLSKELRYSKSTIWRRVKKLEEQGIVKYSERKVYLTELGRIALLITNLKKL